MPVTSTQNFAGALTPTFSRNRRMPIPGARFRVKTTPSGKRVRLAFKDGQVVEAKNLKTGATHTPSQFRQESRQRQTQKSADRTRRAKHRGQIRAAQRLSRANG